MKQKDLLKKLAKLESINDQLAAELAYLEELTKALGFKEGLKTLKSAALEMLTQDESEEFPEDLDESEESGPSNESQDFKNF